MESRKKILTSIALFALLVSFFYFTNAVGSSSDQLQVSFINVGQGDSALISDSSGFDILIDGGKTSAGPTVVAYLKSKPVDDIDVMIASHADSDHIGGLINVLESDIPVEAVYYNGYPGNTTTWSKFATAVANKGLTLTAAQFPREYTWGSVTAYILNPAAGLTNPETNNASVVILFDKQDNEFLFTGDMDSTIEATVVARGTPMAAEVLKVSHHGSECSSSTDFLNVVQPKEAVISVGKNSYCHPSDGTLLRLSTVGARIWRTDENGMVIVDSDGLSWDVIPEVSPTPTATQTSEPITTGNIDIGRDNKDGAYLFGLGILLLFWILSGVVTRSTSLWALAYSENPESPKKLSASKFQALVWTWVTLFAYGSIFGMRLITTESNGPIQELPEIPLNLLVLMGLSAVTAAGSKGITISYKSQGLIPEKSGGLTTNPSGEGDLIKTQMLVWTIVAAGIYLITLINSISNGILDLPDIDGALLVLMGISQGAYVGNKLVSTSVTKTPKIIEVLPLKGFTNTTITIMGENFGNEQGDSFVALNDTVVGKSDPALVSWSDYKIQVMIPKTFEEGETIKIRVYRDGNWSEEIQIFEITRLDDNNL
jgi:competence protein ComEC